MDDGALEVEGQFAVETEPSDGPTVSEARVCRRRYDQAPGVSWHDA